MGLFDIKSAIEKAIQDICSNNNYSYSSALSSYDFKPYTSIFNDESLLADVIYKISRKDLDVTTQMDYISKMFVSICLDSTRSEDKRLFSNMLDLYLNNPELFLMNKNYFRVINSFNDKKIVYELFRYLNNNENILQNTSNENLSQILGFISEARQYYIDDRTLLAASISLIEHIDPVILKYGNKEDIEKIIESKLREARMSCGIYNVDQNTLAEMDSKLEAILGASQSLQTLIATGDEQVSILEKTLADQKSELSQARIKEITQLQEKANLVIKSFNNTYLKLVSEQRESLVGERDGLLAELRLEIEKARTELTSIAGDVRNRVTIELGRISNGGNDAVRRLEEFIKNNEEVKRILREAKTNDDFITRLAALEQLNPTELQEAVEQQEKEQTNQPVKKVISSEAVVIPKSTEVFVPSIIVPQQEERVLDPRVNYFFDSKVPFKDRWAELMSKKQKDIDENGSIYHESFDDSLKFVILGKTPYLIGPSGTGKTYGVEVQMANLLGLKVVTDSYITFEQSILGYTNSGTGAYVPSNFYRCYKYGDIYFLDEIDNGIANATIILNKFMGNSRDSFTFPDGVTINRHPNFRIITAGNTKGSGRTLAYNTRQKLDEATMQRMTPIEYNYDNRIELRILKDYPGWYDFTVNFRRAVEKVTSDGGEEVNTVGTFTTRDAESIKMYLDNNVFDDKKIMLYEIVQTKDEDYLTKIAHNMEEQKANGEFKTKEGARLLGVFKTVCQEKKDKVKCKTK